MHSWQMLAVSGSVAALPKQPLANTMVPSGHWAHLAAADIVLASAAALPFQPAPTLSTQLSAAGILLARAAALPISRVSTGLNTAGSWLHSARHWQVLEVQWNMCPVESVARHLASSADFCQRSTANQPSPNFPAAANCCVNSIHSRFCAARLGPCLLFTLLLLAAPQCPRSAMRCRPAPGSSTQMQACLAGCRS